MNLAVDVGTSMLKAALFSEDGALVGREAAPSPLRQPAPGRFEYGAELFAAVDDLLARAVHRAPDPVRSVSITGQGDGLWLLDADGELVRDAVSWLDARAVDVCLDWLARGVVDDVFRSTANAPFPGAGAAVLAHLDAHEHAVLDAAATATQCQHAVFQRLTGSRVGTASAALLPVFDPATGDYADDAIERCGLAERRGLLPTIAPGPAVIDSIRPRRAAALGLSPDVRIASGPYDLPAAALGVGLATPGDGLLILGTTLACEVVQASVDDGGDAVGLTLCTADRSGWLRAMPAMVGTAGLDWILRVVGRSVEDLEALLAATPALSGGVTALPYLSPSGERAPFFAPGARAELHGLSLGSGPAELVRAVCEGLAYAARHCFEAAGLSGEVTVCGGAANNDTLVQLLADVLGRPLDVVAGDEPTARGAVRASALAAGEAPIAAARRRTVEPRGELRDEYAEGFARYRALAAQAQQRCLPIKDQSTN